jgi:hypothetical protein
MGGRRSRKSGGMERQCRYGDGRRVVFFRCGIDDSARRKEKKDEGNIDGPISLLPSVQT